MLYDFETLISKRGVKRMYTIPIEVAFLIPSTGRWFHTKMWPFEPYGDNVAGAIRGLRHVRETASISCIRKIGGLSEAEQGKSMEDVESDILNFLPGGTALTFMAHNGKSFDDHILKHWFPRVAEGCTFRDSLAHLRKVVELPTYSLPILTRSRRKDVDGYMRDHHMPKLCQHRALYDVVALNAVLEHYGNPSEEVDMLTSRLENVNISVATYGKWEDVRGIGKKTGDRLRKRWASPREFELEMSNRVGEVKEVLQSLGVRRYVHVIGLLV